MFNIDKNSKMTRQQASQFIMKSSISCIVFVTLKGGTLMPDKMTLNYIKLYKII